MWLIVWSIGNWFPVETPLVFILRALQSAAWTETETKVNRSFKNEEAVVPMMFYLLLRYTLQQQTLAGSEMEWVSHDICFLVRT